MTSATIGLPLADDRRFFRNLITAMAVVLLAGFATQFAMGRSSFSSPLIIHVHAVVFMSWVAITLAQSWLVAQGNLPMHRRLGKLSTLWVVAMLVLGPWVTLATIQTARTPFFFQPQHFLIVNPLTLVGFAGLYAAALLLRRNKPWHMRLHTGAFVLLLGPGFGRLLPMPLLPPYAFEISNLVALIFPIIGLIRDWRVHGRPHPAWLITIGVLLAALLIARVLAFSPVGDAIYAAATAGGPLAGTNGLDFPPPPGPPPM